MYIYIYIHVNIYIYIYSLSLESQDTYDNAPIRAGSVGLRTHKLT